MHIKTCCYNIFESKSHDIRHYLKHHFKIKDDSILIEHYLKSDFFAKHEVFEFIMKIFILIKNLESCFTYSSFMTNKMLLMRRVYSKERNLKTFFSIPELIKTKKDQQKESPEEIGI